MQLPFFQVDAFATGPFTGNPAAVCRVGDWPEDALLQAIAAENNLSETAFVRAGSRPMELRWFTPATEVNLCGHATLATAHVLFESDGDAAGPLVFETRSGRLAVERLEGQRYRMDLPRASLEACRSGAELEAALGVQPRELLAAGEDLLCLLEDADEVCALRPDFRRLAALPARGIIVTAPGGGGDYCSRFFAPAVGVDEDPVTGSAHCALAPFWSARLGQRRLRARQRSARGGSLVTEVAGDRVLLEGSCRTVITGRFHLP